MKRLIILLGMAFCMVQGHAQNVRNKRLHEAFDEFRKEVHEEFESFRVQCMKEYIEFARNPWKEFEEVKPVPFPKEKTLPPVIFPKEDKDKPFKDTPIVIDEVIDPVVIAPRPQPVQPIEEVPVEVVKYVDFTFFGTPAKVRFDKENCVTLKGTDENSVADALQAMSGKAHDNMILDCLALRDSLQLSDWAYLQMLKTLSYTLAGEKTNDAVLLLMYLYLQSGYKARMAVHNSQLYMLYASPYQIYDQTCYTVDGILYYGVEPLPSSLHICQATYPKEKDLSLAVTTEQHFTMDYSPIRHLQSANRPEVNSEVRVNKNLIDFYNTYPASEIGGNFMTKWAMYANTPLLEEVKEQLYPDLRKHIEGKSDLESVSVILDFVQTAFPYGYDDKEWGFDRAFFAEETLYYKKSDCEDHAILFSRLVRDLIGIKVVLVYYPGHLATAVQFKEDVPGDYLILDGQRFVICDPTYIGAAVGRTMSDMDNKSAKVILLNE